MRLYAMVGVALFGGTLATVAVATVPAFDFGKHGFDGWDMVLGLMIATLKASLVALVFMHLNHERKLIYWMMGLAAVHCVGLIAFTALAEADTIRDPTYHHGVRVEDPGGVSVSRGPFPQTDSTPKQAPGKFGP
ncbi:cytochrome C oxidase subunit IV family protein [Luteolibacter sp. GHJ8]|uniref:Cytochrome C oxidase subunit IV family protein n=1 Tax=Luteolibacter rhizosphaerae TaxID=2989719 RepID=A0ABT3FZF4_9BACT|nr:cytochrome C oxidase subunit IV family protein [Luteolibacter rhizosphaerae]MCW1912956.1 cytochrome C oxidase subunit IV family protein [Luteolibacter rhizosphaerae]